MAYEGPSRLGLVVERVFGSGEPAMAPFRLSLRLLLHLEIPRQHFDNDLRLVHPYNVIIHPDAVLGQRVTIYHNVTIATILSGPRKGSPVIGDDVTIYPNSVIMGDIHVGDCATVGAGSVVIQSVPAGGVVAGNPAHLVSSDEGTRNEDEE